VRQRNHVVTQLHDVESLQAVAPVGKRPARQGTYAETGHINLLRRRHEQQCSTHVLRVTQRQFVRAGDAHPALYPLGAKVQGAKAQVFRDEEVRHEWRASLRRARIGEKRILP
jgi:hypothetical protein